MRSLLLSVLVAGFVVAPARADSLRTFWTAASPARGVPGSEAIVSFAPSGRLEARSPGGAVRPLAIPAGCDLLGLAPDALICRTHNGGPLTVDLATGVVAPLPLAPLTASPKDYEYLYVRAAGRRWIEGEIWLSSDTSPSSLIVPVIVDRVTGTVRALSRTTLAPAPRGWADPTRYLDLDIDAPMRRLCRPVRRRLLPQVSHELGRLVKVGRWTLREVESEASAGRARHTLQACGSRRTLTLPRKSDPVLGRGYVAWFDGRVVRLRNLTTGRVRSYTWHRPGLYRGHVRIAMTAQRLVVSVQRNDGGLYDVSTVALG